MTKNYFIYCLWLAILAIGYLGYEAYKFMHVDYVPSVTDIRLYENTPIWKLAKAVNTENIEDIKYYVNKNPKFTGNFFQQFNRHYKSMVNSGNSQFSDIFVARSNKGADIFFFTFFSDK